MRPCAFLFPGQGSQHQGMGRALADAFPESREVFDAADRALGRSISSVCFDGPEDELALTENTQPAVLTVSVAAWKALESRRVRAKAAAGHSLGEYAAHVAAGTVDFADAVRAVRERGRLMQEAVAVGEGAMAAILGLGSAAVAEICRRVADGDVVSPANFNGGEQIVISGHARAVERAASAALEAGAKRAVPLPVSAPFHCSLMEPAARGLEPVLRSLTWRDPAFPVYTNADATAVASGAAARDALVRQVASPVRWEELVGAMFDSGVETFVEVGPGRVLAGLVRRIRGAARVLGTSTPEDLLRTVTELGG